MTDRLDYRMHHTAATDWMLAAEPTVESRALHAQASAAANQWYATKHPMVKANRQELMIQAEGAASVFAGAFGEQMAEAKASFMQRVAHLVRTGYGYTPLEGQAWSTIEEARSAGREDALAGRPKRDGMMSWPGSYSDAYDDAKASRTAAAPDTVHPTPESEITEYDDYFEEDRRARVRYEKGGAKTAGASAAKCPMCGSAPDEDSVCPNMSCPFFGRYIPGAEGVTGAHRRAMDDDLIDWDKEKRRRNPQDGDLVDWSKQEDKLRQERKDKRDGKGRFAAAGSTYEVRRAADHGGAWLPAGESFEEAEAAMNSLYSDGTSTLVLLKNNFNQSVSVFEVAPPAFAARPYPKGDYDRFYGGGNSSAFFASKTAIDMDDTMDAQITDFAPTTQPFNAGEWTTEPGESMLATEASGLPIDYMEAPGRPFGSGQEHNRGPQNGPPRDLFPNGIPLRGELTPEQEAWLKRRGSKTAAYHQIPDGSNYADVPLPTSDADVYSAGGWTVRIVKRQGKSKILAEFIPPGSNPPGRTSWLNPVQFMGEVASLTHPKSNGWENIYMGSKTADSMFPGSGATVYRNDAGEVMGWSDESYYEPEYDPDDYLPDDDDYEDEDDMDREASIRGLGSRAIRREGAHHHVRLAAGQISDPQHSWTLNPDDEFWIGNFTDDAIQANIDFWSSDEGRNAQPNLPGYADSMLNMLNAERARRTGSRRRTAADSDPYVLVRVLNRDKSLEEIQAYLYAGWKASQIEDGTIFISGHDDGGGFGWANQRDRLLSGLIGTEPVSNEGAGVHWASRRTAANCVCATHGDGSVTTMLCPLHADQDPCWTMARVTGQRRKGSIINGVCTNCGWTTNRTASLHTAARPIYEIAADIKRVWGFSNIAPEARPYLDAMMYLNTINDVFGADSGRGIVAYFLGNASKFRGPEAKALKDELKAIQKGGSLHAAGERPAYFDTGSGLPQEITPGEAPENFGLGWINDPENGEPIEQDNPNDDNNVRTSSRRVTAGSVTMTVVEHSDWPKSGETFESPAVYMNQGSPFLLYGPSGGEWLNVSNIDEAVGETLMRVQRNADALGTSDYTLHVYRNQPGVTASRRTATVTVNGVSLTRVRFDGHIGNDVAVGVDPQGNEVRFRLSPEDIKNLKSVLLSDLAINFSGVDVDESDIIREGSRRTAADGDTSYCRLCGKQLQQMDYAWYALKASPLQRDVGSHYCVPARLQGRPGEFGPDGVLVPGTPGGEGGQYDAPAGTIFDAGGNPIKVSSRTAASYVQECSGCGNTIVPATRRIDGTEGWAEVVGEHAAWGDDRDFQCALTGTGRHEPAGSLILMGQRHTATAWDGNGHPPIGAEVVIRGGFEDGITGTVVSTRPHVSADYPVYSIETESGQIIGGISAINLEPREGSRHTALPIPGAPEEQVGVGGYGNEAMFEADEWTGYDGPEGAADVVGQPYLGGDSSDDTALFEA